MPKTMTPEIENLFVDFKDQRDQLKKMINDLEAVKVKIESLFPEAITARNRFFFDEKVKTATALFSSFLEIRKEIIKSIKDEIDLRRRFELEERDLEETDDDIRRLASRIEHLSGVKVAVIEKFGADLPKEKIPLIEKKPEDEGYFRLDELSKEEEEEAHG